MAKTVRGYREEDDVSPNSHTETFVALKVFIDNWRWQDVPFYLRTGKRLPRQVSEIAIQFRAVPHQSFPPESPMAGIPPGWYCRSSPRKASCWAFRPRSQDHKCTCVQWRCGSIISDTFANPSPEAYETLLWDVMNNDPTLFMRDDQVEAAWRFLMPVLEVWAIARPRDFPNYAAGTWGPKAAEELIQAGSGTLGRTIA